MTELNWYIYIYIYIYIYTYIHIYSHEVIITVRITMIDVNFRVTLWTVVSHVFLLSLQCQGANNTLFLSLWIALLCLLFQSLKVVSNSLQPQGLQHARLPCPSLSPRVDSNSCPLSRWCPTTSLSLTLFSPCP